MSSEQSPTKTEGYSSKELDSVYQEYFIHCNGLRQLIQKHGDEVARAITRRQSIYDEDRKLKEEVNRITMDAKRDCSMVKAAIKKSYDRDMENMKREYQRQIEEARTQSEFFISRGIDTAKKQILKESSRID